MTASWHGLALLCPLCRAAVEGRREGGVCLGCGSSYEEEGGILRLVAGSRSAPGYDPHFFATLRDVEDRHFWFVGRRQVILGALRRHVPDLGKRRLFDVGCGSGGLLEFLSRSGVAVSGACDVYPESLRLVRARLGLPLVLVDEGRNPPLGEGYDLFGMFDVLEHIDDDVGALRALREALRPGGAVVLTVPAHPSLYDEMDEIACHRRRYRRNTLRRAIEAAGLEVRFLSHFMAALVPAMAAVRWAGRIARGARERALERRQAEFRVVPGLNAMLRGLLALERGIMSFSSLPFGSSIIAVAAKPDGR